MEMDVPSHVWIWIFLATLEGIFREKAGSISVTHYLDDFLFTGPSNFREHAWLIAIF